MGSDLERGNTLNHMVRKASVFIEMDANGSYAWCPELKGCHSQGTTLEEAIANIKGAIELYLETLPVDQRDVLLSRSSDYVGRSEYLNFLGGLLPPFFCILHK